MVSASLVYGHLFYRQELLRVSGLQPLTVEKLRVKLVSDTFRLDVEQYHSDGIGEDIDLRTGRSQSCGVRIPVSELNGIALLVGSCLAEHEGGDHIFDLKDLNPANLDYLKSWIHQDFSKAFPKRDWMLKHFSTYLLSGDKDRSASGRRCSYPIISGSDQIIRKNV